MNSLAYFWIKNGEDLVGRKIKRAEQWYWFLALRKLSLMGGRFVGIDGLAGVGDRESLKSDPQSNCRTRRLLEERSPMGSQVAWDYYMVTVIPLSFAIA